MQNTTTVTVNPYIENTVVVDDSRLQKMVDTLALGQQQAAQIGIINAAAALKTAEVAERQATLTESNLMRAALIGAAATLGAALIAR